MEVSTCPRATGRTGTLFLRGAPVGEYLAAAASGREVSAGTQLRIPVRQPAPHTGAASTLCAEAAQQFNLTVLLLDAWDTSDIPTGSWNPALQGGTRSPACALPYLPPQDALLRDAVDIGSGRWPPTSLGTMLGLGFSRALQGARCAGGPHRPHQ